MPHPACLGHREAAEKVVPFLPEDLCTHQNLFEAALSHGYRWREELDDYLSR